MFKEPNAQAIQKARNPRVWQGVCVCLFLALVVLAVFGQTAHFEFVNYDDDLNVYENPAVEKGLSAHMVGWAFSHAQVFNWIPLTTLSHALDCQLFGLHAGGHHLVNVFWHAANAALLFLVLRQMTGSLWRSAFVAALFAIHPLRAESVAWVSERKDVLSAFFFLLTIGAYVRYVRKRCGSQYLVVVLFFALGLLAKGMLVTLPLLLLLLDYWPLGRMKGTHPPSLKRWRTGMAESGEQRSPGVPFWGLVKEKIPLLALSAGACLAAALVPGLIITDAQRIPVFERIGNALVSYVVYLRQMVFPAGLALCYPTAPNGPVKWEVCLAFGLLGAISTLVVVCRKKRPYLLAGWLWYLGMLLPVIGIIQISSGTAHADRYTYLPGIGLALAGTWAVGDWSAGWKYRRVVLGALMMAAIGALVVCAHIQTSYWRDNQSLWTRALARTSGNSMAHNNLGYALYRKGELDKAVTQYRQALEIQPGYPQALNNLGIALRQMGELDDAIQQYRKALQSQPDYAEAHYNLGIALFAKGDTEEAIAQYRQALLTAPENAKAHNNLGIALALKGNMEEAIQQYRKALQSQPDYAEAHYNLGNAFVTCDKLDEAIAQYRQALELNPPYAEAHFNLGNALAKKGQLNQAMAQLRQALAINPRFVAARNNLGVALLQNGQVEEAAAQYRQVLEAAPENVEALNNLAWLLATTSQPSLRNAAEAVALAAKANQLSGGGNPMMLRTLAEAYAKEGSFALASATARRALELAVEEKNQTLAATLQKEINLYEAATPGSR